MSIRFSGDAEIRLGWDRRARLYRGCVVDPYLRFRGGVPLRPQYAHAPTSSDAYDDAATRLATLAQQWARSQRRSFALDEERGRIQIRRIFQSPCPVD